MTKKFYSITYMTEEGHYIPDEVYFLSKDKAQAYVDKGNAKLLRIINEDRVRSDDEKLTKWKEGEALVNAGLRRYNPYAYPEVSEPVTQLGPWDNKFDWEEVYFCDAEDE